MPHVLLDTNLLLLLIVGRTDPSLIGTHKRTRDYDPGDVDVIEHLIAAYDGLVTTPHVLTETSNLLRQIANPARSTIHETLREFILSCVEVPIESAEGCLHEQFISLGLTDAIILTACAMSAGDEVRIELLTADEPVYNHAVSLGIVAELYA